MTPSSETNSTIDFAVADAECVRRDATQTTREAAAPTRRCIRHGNGRRQTDRVRHPWREPLIGVARERAELNQLAVELEPLRALTLVCWSYDSTASGRLDDLEPSAVFPGL